MFRWIPLCFRRRELRRRQIFTYHDGRRRRYVDPWPLWRAIWTHEKFDPRIHLDQARDGDKEATELTLDTIAECFDLARWDDTTGEGLVEDEIVGVLFQLFDFMEELKKNTDPSQTPPPPTTSESSTSTPADGGPTSFGSESSSMPTAHPSEKPPECTSPSAS